MYSSDMIMNFKEHWQDATTMQLFEDPDYCIGIMSEPALFKALDCRLRETKELYDRQYAERLRELNYTEVRRWGGGDSWNWFMIALAGVGCVAAYKVGKTIFKATPAGQAYTMASTANDMSREATKIAAKGIEKMKKPQNKTLMDKGGENVTRRGISKQSQSGIVSFDTNRGHFMGILRSGNKGNELYQRV